MAGLDEDLGFAGVGLEGLALGFSGDVFERADGGGAYGYDSAIFVADSVEGLGGFRRKGVALAVELDF